MSTSRVSQTISDHNSIMIGSLMMNRDITLERQTVKWTLISEDHDGRSKLFGIMYETKSAKALHMRPPYFRQEINIY
jgi:hypothetical protein